MFILMMLFNNGYRDSVASESGEDLAAAILEFEKYEHGSGAMAVIGGETARMVVKLDQVAMMALTQAPEEGDGALVPEN